MVTEAGLLAVGYEPMANAMTGIHNGAPGMPVPKPPIQREGTKQAMLIATLRAPTGATMEEVVAATGWQAHSARSAMSGALGKKSGLVLTSIKKGPGGYTALISRRADAAEWPVRSADDSEPRSVYRRHH